MRLPDDLLAAAADANLNVLVGSGLSIDVGLPNWGQLLRQLANCVANVQRRRPIESLIEADRLLDAAELLREDLPPARLARQLKLILDIPVTSSPVSDAVWSLQPRFVLTTNFDNLLETSLARKLGRSAQVLLPQSPVQAMGGDTNHRIAKIHGDPGTPESIVLSRGDYFRVMLSLDGGPSSIWTEFVRRPTLAIGYGLRDPDFQLLLAWIEERMRGLAQTLFVVVPVLPEEERRLLARLPNVALLEYDASAGHRPALLELLRQLAQARWQREHVARPLEVRGALLRSLHDQALLYLHDFRGALALLQGYRELLGDGYGDRDLEVRVKMGDALDRAVAAAHAISSTIVAGKGHLSPSNWRQCRETLTKDLAARRYGDVQSEFDAASDDEIPVSDVLFSVLARVLVDNALDAVKQIGLEDPRVELRAQTLTLQNRRYLQVRVRDRGPGIPDTLRARLFVPNASTKGEGRGLGLYLLRCLVEQVGGAVELTSDVGKGTVATFRLPFGTQHRVLTEPTAAIAAPLSLQGLEIALVDDDAEILGVLTIGLERFGATVLPFFRPEEALRMLRERGKSPDCLVTDQVMPSMNGSELIDALRATFPSMPAIIQSGYTYATGSLSADLGVGVLQKPASLEELVHAITTRADGGADGHGPT